MTNDPRAFVYWLQGYAEICGARPTAAQWEMIKEHLALVFTKVTGKREITLPSPLGPAEDATPTYCSSVPAPKLDGGNLLCSKGSSRLIC